MGGGRTIRVGVHRLGWVVPSIGVGACRLGAIRAGGIIDQGRGASIGMDDVGRLGQEHIKQGGWCHQLGR